MPIKQPVKERAWGSRYDTLKSFPPSPSSQTSPVANTTATPQSPIAIQTTDTEPVEDDRPSKVGQSPVVHASKPSNDNSIFVGSLPTNIEPAELGHMLTLHLAEYPQIKDVKAIRDGKGGVCAFLACESAAAASQLLKNLHESPPQLFHSRTLRFEFARASRALIISYRTPIRLAYPNSGLESPCESDRPSDMPFALRIVRPRNAKFPAVLYDNEAVNFSVKDPSDPATPHGETASADDVLSGVGVLIEPLRYDAETLQKIVSVFGPIDSFGPFASSKEGDALIEPAKALRPFADITRSPGMEDGVWEVKWQRRDDSVLAHMILRRIPHLSVMWTHHFNSEVGPDSRYGSPSTSPGPLYSSMSRMRHLSRSYVNEADYQRIQEHFPSFPAHISPSSSNLRLTTSPYSEGAVSPQFNRWSPQYNANHMRGPSSPLVQRDSRTEFTQTSVSGQGFNDADFPPLHEPGRFRKLTRPPSLPWIPRGGHTTNIDRGKSATLSPSPSSSLSVQPSTPGVARSTPSPPVDEGQNVVASQLPSSLTIRDSIGEADVGQDITVPPTPDFTAASITPMTPKTGTSYPLTPLSPATMDSVAHSDHYNMTPRRTGRFGGTTMNRDDADVNREVDPCSVFVGNLDISVGWSEEQLRGIFEKYGRLEEVSFHVPFSKTVGFAFLRFADAESSARAIAGENTRKYHGRPMRVQIREVKPPGQRTPFKATRGRGRPRIYGESPRHIPSPGGIDFNERPHDDFSAYSPRSTHGYTQYRQEPRHGTQTGRDAPPHLSRGHHATDSNVSGQLVLGRPSEMKERSPPFDVHSAASWRPPTSHADSISERAVITSSATSASVSPPPSSSGSHSASTVGYASPYPMMMNPWMHPYPHYPYPMQYMGAPYMGYPPPAMAPYAQPPSEGANSDTSTSHQQAWEAQARMYKQTGYQAAPAATDPNMSSMYPGSGSATEVQPPLRAVAFEQTDTGMFVPMYAQDALNQYMSAHGQVQPPGQTPPPQGSTTHSQQPHPQPPSVYMPPHAVPQMPMYPYPYPPQMTVAPPPAQPGVTAGGQYQLTATGWTQAAPWNPQQISSSTYLQPVPPSTYLGPSQPSAPLTSSVSFTGHYAGTGSASGEQQYGGARGQVPPRRGGNRAMQGYNNKNVNHRASPGGFHRQAGEGQMGASHSFAEGLSMSRSQQFGSGGMRPYPTPYAGHQ